MPVQFVCPHCGLETLVADEFAGRSGPCARCGKLITVPPLGTPFGYYAPPSPRKSSAWVVLMAILIAGGIAVLLCAGLTFSFWGTSTARAQRNRCANNLKQIGLALHNYHTVYDCFPPAYVADANGRPMHSWRVLLLPYLDHQELYDQYRFDEPWNSPHNLMLSNAVPDVYRCPDAQRLDDESCTTDYMMIVGPGMFSSGTRAACLRDIKDGASNTIMVVEVSASDVVWTQPQDLEAKSIDFSVGSENGQGIGGNHPEGPNVLFADGSVSKLPNDTPPSQVKAMATIAGGEVVKPLSED